MGTVIDLDRVYAGRPVLADVAPRSGLGDWMAVWGAEALALAPAGDRNPVSREAVAAARARFPEARGGVVTIIAPHPDDGAEPATGSESGDDDG